MNMANNDGNEATQPSCETEVAFYVRNNDLISQAQYD